VEMMMTMQFWKRMKMKERSFLAITWRRKDSFDMTIHALVVFSFSNANVL
jgi:hypothetical protein